MSIHYERLDGILQTHTKLKNKETGRRAIEYYCGPGSNTMAMVMTMPKKKFLSERSWEDDSDYEWRKGLCVALMNEIEHQQPYPYTFPVYHGTYGDWAEELLTQNAGQKLKRDKRFTSCSLKYDVAEKRGEQKIGKWDGVVAVKFMIERDYTKQSLGKYVRPYSNHGYEYEFLLNPKVDWIIEEVKEIKGLLTKKAYYNKMNAHKIIVCRPI